jgi:hypothetical protein
MDSDKKDNEGGRSNLGIIIGLGSVLVIILLLLVLNSESWAPGTSQMDLKSNNFGFSLEDAFNIMK